MQADDLKALADVRLGHALECLDTAQKVMELGDYKCAANRSYYAVFHIMHLLSSRCIYFIYSEYVQLWVLQGHIRKAHYKRNDRIWLDKKADRKMAGLSLSISLKKGRHCPQMTSLPKNLFLTDRNETALSCPVFSCTSLLDIILNCELWYLPDASFFKASKGAGTQ